jgi:glycosyltransferase involved in cell wall biosynthesis
MDQELPPDPAGTSGRVVIVQPVLPRYRLRFFERLAALPGLDLTVLADLATKDPLNQYDAARDRFRAVHLPRRQVGPFVVRSALRRRLATLSPGAVVLNCGPRDWSEYRALGWCRRRGVGTAVWNMLHRIGRRRLFTEWHNRRIGREADLLLGYGQRDLREQTARGTPADKIVILHNCIDEREVLRARDAVTPRQVDAFRREADLVGKRVVLHVVRLTSLKRPDRTVEAFAAVARRRPEAVLVFIGGGPLEGTIRRQAAGLGLSDRVRFLGPVYDQGRLSLWYKCADVFVMATCIGLSIHHAMAYGVPVITDDDPRTQTAEFEVLEDGGNGLLYRAGDARDYADKICCILEDPDLRSRLSRRAADCIENEHTLDRMVGNMESALRRLLALANARRAGRA